ncbi:MAG TPA: biotin carboxylase N-terminal domain-containing protein [Gaiellales bacterium]|nr:biotin carboxylase N-terminal domain-containing protein [Gaiellales bacterium]
MGPGLKRVLIANRGEIAVRIARACRELSIGSVAAYERADRRSLHTEVADEAVEVASYLDADALVDAATASGADAVHPGYGFLAESPEFAEAVAAAKLVFVGPPPSALRAAGDKIEARRLAEAVGIPVTPGYAGVDLGDETLEAEAIRLGFPLMVKAAAGGGGRGMRTVLSAPALADAIAAARREAAAAFGDGRVYLERLVGSARHVEVQVLADAHGTVLHLGERDCSLQRRHQKIVEESPSPAVDPGLRKALGEAAVSFARAAGYVGAGTAEFLLAPDGSWHFLELNARLQVEHPVTEAVTGIDLVRAQLEIAAGEPLVIEQEDVAFTGHAIECRLYAEDPAAGFLPASGRLVELDLPRWPGVRVDSGVRAGDDVGTSYDPMLAKLIAHAEDRDACIDRMRAALAETAVLGVATNLGFLCWALGQPAFRAGEAGTDFVEREWSAALVPELPEEIRRAALAHMHASSDPWFAFGPPQPRVRAAGGFVLHEGWHFAVGAADDAPSAGAIGPVGSLAAPMPGTVLRIDVHEGEHVDEGQTLVLLEAMKMELAVTAPAIGVVSAVLVEAGQLVARGQALVELEGSL